MNHVQLLFLPGSAGDFLGRSLCLSENIWSTTLYDFGSIEEKFNAYSYKKSKFYMRWTIFERSIVANNKILEFSKLPEDAVILYHHTNHQYSNIDDIVGETDNIIYSMIDINDNKKWVLYNSVYKESPTLNDERYLTAYNSAIQDKNVIKFNLDALLSDSESYFSEYCNFAYKIGLIDTNINKKYVIMLYDEWRKTILEKHDLDIWYSYNSADPIFKNAINNALQAHITTAHNDNE